MPKLLEVLESARSRGVDAMFDVYPYEAGSSYATYFFAEEVRMLPPDELRGRLRDPERRREICCELLERTDLRATFIVHASVDADVQEAITHRLATICSDGIPVGDRPHPRGWVGSICAHYR
jgi:N-acyl-D-aspartate/D-glutamate deacylase